MLATLHRKVDCCDNSLYEVTGRVKVAKVFHESHRENCCKFQPTATVQLGMSVPDSEMTATNREQCALCTHPKDNHFPKTKFKCAKFTYKEDYKDTFFMTSEMHTLKLSRMVYKDQ